MSIPKIVHAVIKWTGIAFGAAVGAVLVSKPADTVGAAAENLFPKEEGGGEVKT